MVAPQSTYTVKQIASILGFSTNSIYTFLKEKRIRGIRMGKTGRFRISENELQHLLGVFRKTKLTEKDEELLSPPSLLLPSKPFSLSIPPPNPK
ncbi:helix-turn-helix domain-containing protein, partial [Patescibacteria group bacterium]|nr:helix-turn-helix domain-containing protein [Patescibacteria group bacterium]